MAASSPAPCRSRRRQSGRRRSGRPPRRCPCQSVSIGADRLRGRVQRERVAPGCCALAGPASAGLAPPAAADNGAAAGRLVLAFSSRESRHAEARSPWACFSPGLPSRLHQAGRLRLARIGHGGRTRASISALRLPSKSAGFLSASPLPFASYCGWRLFCLNHSGLKDSLPDCGLPGGAALGL